MKLSKKQEYRIIAGLLVLIFPFFALLFYVHPQGDDFFFAYKVNKLGVFPFVREMYFNWSGRYASMFLGALDPFRHESLWLHRQVLGALFIFNIFSLYFLIRAVLNKQVIVLKTILISLSVYIVILNAIPDVFEFYYWYPGATAYQFGLSLLLLFISNIVLKAAGRRTNRGYLLFNGLIALILPGILELYIPLIVVSMILLILHKYRSKQELSSDLIVLFLILISSILVVAAPGNYTRLNVENTSGFIIGFYLAAKSMIYLMGYLFQNPVFTLGSFLFLGVIYKMIRSENVLSLYFPPVHPAYVFAFTFVMTYLVFLPSTLALVCLPAGRIFNLAAFVFTLLWMYSLAFLVNYYRQRVHFELSSLYQWLLAALMFMFTFSGIYITNPYEFAQKKEGSVLIYGNILNAWHTLIFEAGDFDRDMMKRYNNFKQAELNNRKTLVVEPLEHHPEMLIFVDITDLQSPGTWIFNWEAKYYGMDSVRIANKKIIIQEPIKSDIQERMKENNTSNE